MKISNNSMAIIILCSHLAIVDDVKPLETIEWSKLADILLNNNMQPSDVIDLSTEELGKRLLLDESLLSRIEDLKSRSANITFEIEKLHRQGIGIVTRADKDYPVKLKRTIVRNCPPLFYYAGDLNLAAKPLVGMVGSRSITDTDIEFTKFVVSNVINQKMGIVSGGAKGVDSTATSEALNLGGYAVEYLANSMQRKLKNLEVISAISEGRLLVLSETKPSAGFNVGFAMKRNKYIYGNSIATIVVKTDLKKGGTWTGAIENINRKWSPILCWHNLKYKGNTALIEKGAIPIDKSWDFDFEDIKDIRLPKNAQLSLFDLKE